MYMYCVWLLVALVGRGRAHEPVVSIPLRELGQGGWADRLYKSLHWLDMPVGIFLVFCQGGVDFVGGFVMY